MNISRFRLLPVSLLLAALAFPAWGQAAEKPTLGIGSAAPEIKVLKWFKGTPVKEFKQGQVYVMEFWATWCAPCIAAMPHVTELAKKYQGKATIIGVSVWERPEQETDAGITALVTPFVDKQGDRMVYNVAAEGADAYMATHWLKAAGQNAIPCTMIINKDRKIAWIGHPMEMDKPLDEIIAGTWDIKAAADRYAKDMAEREARDVKVQKIREAIDAKDQKRVVTEIDAVLKDSPDMEPVLMPVKFDALIQSDEAAAFAFLKSWFESGKIDKDPVNGYNAFTSLSRYAANVKNPDWTLMAKVLQKANDLRGKKDAQIMAASATAYFKTGNKAKAIEYQEQAIELAGKGTVPAPWLEQQKKNLAEYKAAK